mgnify:FL=1|jgi:hypothetical protein|tara:strand:+ start:452 stop:589 length:138 start_codon:yes stop_codon:yes gene_type:complete
MAKPTTEELQAELQTVVNQFNEANRRIIEIQAILNDRATPESDAT